MRSNLTTDAITRKTSGVNNAGSQQGLQFVVGLVKDKVINPDMDYSVAEASFNKGKLP